MKNFMYAAIAFATICVGAAALGISHKTAEAVDGFINGFITLDGNLTIHCRGCN